MTDERILMMMMPAGVFGGYGGDPEGVNGSRETAVPRARGAGR